LAIAIEVKTSILMLCIRICGLLFQLLEEGS
jgi:hypothetical protein